MTTQRVPKKISALAAGALFASGTLLAGCSGASTAQEPQAPASATESPEPAAPFEVPAEPVLPDAAKEPTEAGAQAFIQYYFELMTWSYEAQDASQLALASDGSFCTGCNGYVSDIQKMTSRGERSTGALRTATNFKLLQENENPAFQYLVTFDQEPEQVFAVATGELLREQPFRENLNFTFSVSWQSDRWLAVELVSGSAE